MSDCVRTPLPCDRRSVWLLRLGFIPAGVTNPPLAGDGNKHGARASCPCTCARFSLGVFLAVGLSKYRMFAVLLWALRVHSISAAARFSSIESLVSFLVAPLEEKHFRQSIFLAATSA